MRDNIGLYRGKRKDNGEWINGFYFQKPNPLSEDGLPIYHGISDLPPFGAEVDPETIGEYTGKTDKKNKKIFESDIVSHFINWLGKRVNGVVRYDNITASWVCDFVLDDKKESAFLADWVNGNGAEIIGNVWDNPEFLEEKK